MREDIEDVGSSFAESTCVRAEEVHKRQNCNGDLSHFRDGHWHFHGLSANLDGIQVLPFLFYHIYYDRPTQSVVPLFF